MVSNKKPGLTDEQKAQVRTAVAAYKEQNPQAKSKEILANLDLAFKDQVTEAMLRGFAPRRPRATGTAQQAPESQQPAASEPRTRRSRKSTRQSQPSIEQLIQNLTQLQQQRADIDSQIGKLETEVRERVQRQLGAEYTQQLFTNVD